MKKLQSLNNKLFKTLENKEMKKFNGGHNGATCLNTVTVKTSGNCDDGRDGCPSPAPKN